MSITFDFIVTLLIGVLTGLGVGSGGLLLVYMTLVHKTEQIMAQGLNLAFFVYAALASIIVNLIKKRIDLKVLMFISVFGICGVFLGSYYLPMISPAIIRKIFGGILITLSLITFFSKPENKNK